MTFNKIFKFAFLLIAVLFASAGAADASDISLFIGAELPGSVDIPTSCPAPANTSCPDYKQGLDNGPVYGLRFGSDFIRYLGMEHTLALSPDFLFPSGDTSVEKAKGFLYSSNLKLSFPDIDERMVPFLTAGVGLIHQYGDRNLPVGTKFAFNYGGGLKFPSLAGPLGARIDLRGYRTAAFSRKVNIVELSVGLMISLGR
jgi:opacity protein-like surface antigen